MLDRLRRFAIFLERLSASPPASSHDEALRLLSDMLDAVEDEFSGVSNDPARYRDDGRLYPPQRDSRRTVPQREDLVRYRSRLHNTFIRTNGAILIETIPKDGTVPTCCLDKPGADGETVKR